MPVSVASIHTQKKHGAATVPCAIPHGSRRATLIMALPDLDEVNLAVPHLHVHSKKHRRGVAWSKVAARSIGVSDAASSREVRRRAVQHT